MSFMSPVDFPNSPRTRYVPPPFMRLSAVTLPIAIALYVGGLTDASAQSRCRVMDPTGTPLNVRTTPNGHIVGTLNNGDQVTVLDRTSDRKGKAWVYVGNYENNKPIGWVFREFIACGVEQVPAIRPRSRDDAAQQNSRICFDPGAAASAGAQLQQALAAAGAP
jgi:SH3 domain-containing protein